jgi:hypothetical protein
VPEGQLSNYQDRIKPVDFGIQTYLGNIQAGSYQIPTFQRHVVWERGNVKLLWDSVYKFYPLGSILVWRTNLPLHSHRAIGGHVLNEQKNAADYRYILDGQQRTTTLYTSIYGGMIEGQSTNPRLYVDLSIALTGQTDDDSYRERFLFWDEIDDKNGSLLRNKGRQMRYNDGLVVSLYDIMHQYGNLDSRLSNRDYEAPERQRLRQMQGILANYRLSFIELHGIEVSEVCQIFERVNQAGRPLNIFDIVVAKTYRVENLPAGVTGFYLRAVIQDFRDSLGNSHYALLDDWTFLQMLAVCVRIHQQAENVSKTVLNITDKYLNELKAEDIELVWEKSQSAIRKTFSFLNNTLNLNGPNLIPYRYFYMTLTGYFFDNPSPSLALLQRYFWFSCFHHDDLLSNTTGLWEHVDLLRGGNGSDIFGKGFSLDRNALRQTKYSTRGRLARALLALYAHHYPRDWAEGHGPVLNDVYYTLTDRPNLHHIFPSDFVEKSAFNNKSLSESLLNIAYLPQLTNLKISNKNPLDYLGTYVGLSEESRDEFLAVLKTHLVPTEIVEWQETMTELSPDALEQFIEARLKLVIAALSKKLVGVEMNIYDGAPLSTMDKGPSTHIDSITNNAMVSDA